MSLKLNGSTNFADNTKSLSTKKIVKLNQL